MDCSPVALNSRMRWPTKPEIDRLVNVATPLPLVLTVVLPVNVPPPEVIDAVTATFARLTGLPSPSSSRTTGCGFNGTPLDDVPPGWVTMPSLAAEPELISNSALVAGLIPPAALATRV